MAQLEFDYVRDLAHEVARNDELRNEIAADPVGALTRHQLRTSPQESIQFLTVPVLAFMVVAVGIVAIIMASNGRVLPAEVTNLASIALGGLVGLKAGRS